MLKILIMKATFIALVGSISFAAHAVADTQRIEIPAGELVAALESLAKQADVDLVYSDAQVRGIRTGGVSGNMSAQEAIAKLLEGTPLEVRADEVSGALLIAPPAVRPPAPMQPPKAEAGGLSAKPQTSNQYTHGAEEVQKKSFWDRFRVAQVDQGKSTSVGSLGQSRASPESNDGAKLEEIVVTAQKREERLIDTPQSVSVLSSADLSRLGATQFRDFADTIPGLSFATAGAGNTQVTLRGVSVGGDVSPAVGIYADEVPYGPTSVFNLGPQFALDAALFDLDRIEVLRGPQGTLYGASTMGGLIKYVNKRPQMGTFGSTVQAGIATTGDGGVSYNAAATINAPLSADRVALRASAFESRDGGYVDNLAQDQDDVNRSDIYGGRVDLLLTPVDALSIRLNAFLQNISRDGEGTVDYTFAGAKPYGTLGQSRQFDEPFDQRFRLVSATLDYDMGGASLISISSYQTMRSDFVIDLSSLFAPLFGLGAVGLPGVSSTDKWTQEVRLASRESSRPVEWVLGGFYTHESSNLDEGFSLRDLAGHPTPNNLFTYSVPSRYEEYAAFGDLTWHFSDKFDVTGGLRYARNNQQKSQSGSGALGLSHPTLRSNDDVFTYLANARYHFSDHAVGYLRYATGYRPGGPNIVTVAGGSPVFEADRLKSYEAGFKMESADGRFGLDLAGYHIDWSNVQISINDNGFQSVANASAGAEIRGAELKLTARPMRAFTVITALTYTHAELSEADAALGGAKGERLPITPRFAGTLSGDYEFAFASMRPTLGATLRHVSDRTISFEQSPSLPQYTLPDYTAVDLRAGLTWGSVSTQFYVRNVLDEHGQLSILFPQFGGRVAILQPRTFGMNVSMDF